MSKKDVNLYFDKVCEDYHNMIEALHDIEDECATQVTDLDKIEQVRKMIEPIKTNYMRISYIMYLLNQPNRKEKQSRYKLQNKKLLNQIGNNKLDDVLEEDKQIISQMKN